ncbi:MAG: DUF4338 domain-containing protein [Desulfobacter sp.]|nr:DUF4338 domain-containing protein [Desulfobacter sp.]
MITIPKPVTRFGSRSITEQELEHIKQTIDMFGNLSVKELTHTICEHLNWRTPSGTNKWDACAKMLRAFEKKGEFKLPAKRLRSKPKPKSIVHSKKTDPSALLSCDLKELDQICLTEADTREQKELWNEYTDRYHYLGYKKPFGYRIRYFITSGDRILGCLLFSGAAKTLARRDRWIGWSSSQREQTLPWVINNSRFLIFSWVRIKNLASHVLGKADARVAKDWKRKWGFSPVLMETFVDPAHYPGTCYLAANWKYIGMTTGKGRVRNHASYKTSPKKIFVHPLTRQFSTRLCLGLDTPRPDLPFAGHRA